MSKETNVYFNKQDERGNGKYRTGHFVSAKNKSSYVYRSAYEYAFFTKLENDDTVVQFIVEPFQVPYVDSRGKQRVYKPDIVVLYSDGTLRIYEIKPKAMLRNLDVQSKAAGCRAFIRIQRMNATYHFVTEEDIFANLKEYQEVLKRI